MLEEGRRHHVVMLLVSGSVRVTNGGTEIHVIDEPGAVFGEMAALLDGEATATVTTLTECVFRRTDDPLAVLREQPGFALEVATTLARRLDLVTRYLADVRAQYADREDHLGVVDEVLESLLQRQSTKADPGSEREPEAPYDMAWLVVSDLHYALRQLDWVCEAAGDFDLVVIAGDVLDLRSAVPIEAQSVAVAAQVARIGARAPGTPSWSATPTSASAAGGTASTAGRRWTTGSPPSPHPVRRTAGPGSTTHRPPVRP